MRSWLVPVLVLLAGCDLYFSGDDDCDLIGAPDIAPLDLRNPDTGQCSPFGNFPCDGVCGPCAEAADQPQPDWGVCFGTCDQLDEASCAADPTCRVVYDANSNVDEPPRFLQCWAIAPSGPAEPGGCDGLGAYDCSRHNDCIAFYDDLPDGTLQFSRCGAGATGCFGDQDCGAGTHCSVDDGVCGSPPGCDQGQACPDVCYGTCVANTPTCEAIDCGPGSHCEQQCTPQPDGTVVCESTCVPDQMTCGPGTCPPDTQCVEKCDGKGTCTPACVPTGACEGLPTEADCQDRADCRPVYLGDDCTCQDNGSCECEVLTYDHCETP